MNLNQFIQWALAQGSVGKYTDGTFVGECVSLISQYCYRVLGVPAGAWGNAIDWASDSNPNRAYFDKVSTPQAGDIGIMGSNFGNGFGHIFVYTSPNTIIEQNGRTPHRITTGAAYANPIAILRPKTNPSGGDHIMTKEEAQVLYQLVFPNEPLTDAYNNFVSYWTGKPASDLLTYLKNNGDRQKFTAALVNDAYNWRTQKPSDCQTKLDQIKKIVS